ncbi:MAG TPA: hypothetical protein VMT57_00855, partial [Candidatus Thermoplasmatota archaeon]|nr:hypothetical protein [Candidatus Thermoplasmatota archaeon]
MLPQWLSISKDDGIGVHGFVYPGDPFQYNITYSNPTLLTVHNVSVIDHLDTKVDYISSIPTGYYISQFHQVYWNFSSLNPGQGGTIKLLVHAKNGTAGTIVHNNVTIYSTETLPTNASHTTLIWEGNKPVTSIHIGQPRYTPGDWITSHTPIWLNATDDFAGVKEIDYRINGIEHIAAGNTTMFYVVTDCQAALQYWAIDYFNNIETTHNRTFFVDDTPPIITVETGEPSYEGFIGRNTPVWFNATDQGYDGGVGLKNLTYTVYHKIGSSWVYQYGSTVVDNDQNDTDPTRGTISVEFHFNDTGQHQIRYCTYDLLGNRQPNSGYQTQDFYVDADGPVMTCNFGDPKNNYFRSQNGQWYVGIGSTTPVILHADDGTGVGADALY